MFLNYKVNISSFQNVVLFSYSGNSATTDAASTEKDRLERKHCHPFRHLLREDSLVPPLQLQCNIMFSTKTTFSIFTACTGKNNKNYIYIYIKKRRYRGYYRNLLPMWVTYVCGQACCIKTKSREPVNIICFQARCLLSNTLCHLTAVRE